MTHRTASAPARGVVIALPITRDPVPEARLVAVAPDVSALVFEASEAAGALMAFVDGTRLEGALIGARLELRSGGVRQIVLLGLGAECLRGRAVALVRGNRVVAAIDPDWLQSPDAEIASLLEDLTEDGALRLLRLLLTTGASLFRSGAVEFAALSRRLLSGLGAKPLAPVAVSATGTAGRLVTWRVSPDLDAERIGDLVALTPARPLRLARLPLHLEPTGKGPLLHVELPRRLPVETLLVATGGARLTLSIPDTISAGGLHAFLSRRDPATVAFAHRLVEARIDRDPVAAAIADELCHAGTAAPALAARHLSGTARGVLLALTLDDPHGLAAGIRVTRGSETAELAAGPRIEAYLPLARESRIDDRCRIALVHRSGRIVPAIAAPLPRYDGSAPAGLLDISALAAARLDLERPRGAPRVDTYGRAAGVRLTMLAALSDDLDLVRARAASIFAERDARHVEVVCWTAQPALAEAARSAMAHAAAVWGVSHRLVTLPEGTSDADGLREAVALAGAPRLLCLAPHVLPGEPGWLAACLRARSAMLLAPVRDHDGAPSGEDCGAVVFSKSVCEGLATAGCTNDATLLAALADSLAADGARVAKGGPAFTDYRAAARSETDRRADAATLELRRKRSFSLGCEE